MDVPYSGFNVCCKTTGQKIIAKVLVNLILMLLERRLHWSIIHFFFELNVKLNSKEKTLLHHV